MIRQSICALVTRLLFILLSFIGVWKVVMVKDDEKYWCLIFLLFPLVMEMGLTLVQRNGKDYKWFSPAIFLFLISIIPSLWLLELHHQENKLSDSRCDKLDSTESIRAFLKGWQNSSNGSEPLKSSVILLSSVCDNNWILALHQVLLILLILGKWLLASGVGITRNQLSEQLLIFVSTAADILEFTNETLSDVKDSNPILVYIILGVWTWSMLQFPLHTSVFSVPVVQLESQGDSLRSRLKKDIWSIMGSFFIQDGPFLVVRLTVIVYFNVIHQMLIFFSIKNFLVVILNLYRLFVIICDHKSSSEL